jgi:basic amino acid/polyamine antiporter, APA family
MRRALGQRGARIIALGIAVSTVGFLSQSVLTAPRVYYAMARDGVFFKTIGWLDPKTRVPTAAILLQGVWASVIAASGKYEQILNYVVSIDLVMFGLTGASLLIFRARAKREPDSNERERFLRVPLHPLSTMLFVAACWGVALTTIVKYPRDAGVGVAILVLGVLVFQFWRTRAVSNVTQRS